MTTPIALPIKKSKEIARGFNINKSLQSVIYGLKYIVCNCIEEMNFTRCVFGPALPPLTVGRIDFGKSDLCLDMFMGKVVSIE